VLLRAGSGGVVGEKAGSRKTKELFVWNARCDKAAARPDLFVHLCSALNGRDVVFATNAKIVFKGTVSPNNGFHVTFYKLKFILYGMYDHLYFYIFKL
jgi:hypothetical protein